MAKHKTQTQSALRVKRKKPTGTGKIISPMNARIIERRLLAFNMRRDGYTISEIASVLGVCEPTVAGDIRTAMSLMAKETKLTVEEEREIEAAGLDSITKSFMPLTRERIIEYPDPKNPKVIKKKVLAPDPSAAQVVLGASDRRRKLKALDLPEIKRLEVSAIREYRGIDIDKV
jgi:hypothetical protein